ncbi:hypothetical protein UFOVP249_46 [uncultured Caudovirales phage]|uniref:Uncharacterized protein n=1 Tax=uncultured Caudovirales phage TaxID=2100421 RepID=A0A6J5LIL3_9CAUD|nr:hypothetical protein UFOVP249_46 [uncultured Caudovirales phage]
MDGLEALTGAVGPGMSAYNAGVDTSRKYEEQQNQQALRQAQMQEILQNMKQREINAPLDMQVKQQQLQNAQLEGKIKQNETYSSILEKAGPMLEAVPPAARHAQLMNMVKSHGLDANDPEIQGFMQSMQNVPADKIPAVLAGISSTLTQQSRQYQQALAVAEIQRKSHVEGAQVAAGASRYATDQRAAQAAAKAKGVSSIQDLVRSGKMTAEKAAVAFHGAAQFETDPVEAQKLSQMAQQYEQLAMNQRNAQATGKVDVGAVANLPTQNIPPALGNQPKLGTAENPIKLK